MPKDRKKIRLASCVETIIQVQASLDKTHLDSTLVEKLDTLERNLKDIETSGLSELDVTRVEVATNLLLGEIKTLFHTNPMGPFHWAALH